MQPLIQEIQPSELDHTDQNFQIVDIREIPELAAGKIETAETMPMASIPMRLAEFDRDRKIVLVCRSGARSAQACMFLQQQGFDNVFNLRGGMIGWLRAAKPFIRG